MHLIFFKSKVNYIFAFFLNLFFLNSILFLLYSHYITRRFNFTTKIYFSIPHFMKKLILLFLFINACFTSLLAQHLSPLQEAVVRKTMSAQFGVVGNTRILNLGKDVFCVVGNDTLYNPDGYNYVFKLHHDTIERLDCSLYHGSNHGRFLFVHNGELCALGGYGFFTTNNNLQVFNPNVKEWLFKPTTGDVPNYIWGFCFKKGDEVYTMNNFKSGNGTAPNKVDSCIYKLNLKTMNWKRFYQMDYPTKVFGITYYTNQYSLIIGDFQTIIAKPSEFKFLAINNEVLGNSLNIAIDSIGKDVIFFKSKGSANSNHQLYSIDLNVVWNKHAGNIKSFRLIPFNKDNLNKESNLWFIISILLFIIVIVGYFVMRQSSDKSIEIMKDANTQDMIPQNPSQPKTESQIELISESLQDSQTDNVVDSPTEIEDDLSDSLYKTLLQCEKTFFNGDELDEIFGISHLEPDSKKSKRHRFLAELNTNHPGFITKSKDQTDKRRFNYKIVK